MRVCDQDVLHILNVLQKADAANIHALASHRQIISACIGVARGDGCDDLGERHVKLQQFAWVNFRDVFSRAAAEPGDINNPGDLLDFARDEPVLRSLQFVQAVIRSVKAVTIDLADGRFGRELRAEIGQVSETNCRWFRTSWRSRK